MGEIDRWVDEKISLDLGWRRSFIVHEESMMLIFFSVPREFQFSEKNGRCVWRHTRDRLFSVASAYQIQVGPCYSLEDALSRENTLLPIIWDS